MNLFQLVVEECGIAGIIAKGVVERACLRAGIRNPERLTRIQLPACLESMIVPLNLYLGEEEANRRLQSIGAMSRDIEVVIDLAAPSLDD